MSASIAYENGRTPYQIGPYIKANLAAGATTILGLVAAGAGSFDWSVVMLRAGFITGITVDFSPSAAVVITAGTCQIQMAINGVLSAVAGTFLTAGVGTGVPAFPSRVFIFALTTPIAIAAGDTVGMQAIASAGLLPNNNLDPVAMFEFTPT